MSIQSYQAQISTEKNKITNYQNEKITIDRNIDQLEEARYQISLIISNDYQIAAFFALEGWMGTNYNHHEEEGTLNYIDGYGIYYDQLEEARDTLTRKIQELEDNSNELSKHIKNAENYIKSLNHAIQSLEKEQPRSGTGGRR